MAEVKLMGKPVHTNGDLPKVGSKAPDFVLVDATLRERTLHDFKGKKKVLSIVPSLDTPTCSISAKKFNESASQYPNAVILVISADLPFAQKRFCGSEGLKNIITLSLLRSKKFAEDYGVLLQDGPIAGLCTRTIFVLDEQDKIVYSQLVSEISEEPDYEKALKFLQGP